MSSSYPRGSNKRMMIHISSAIASLSSYQWLQEEHCGEEVVQSATPHVISKKLCVPFIFS